MPAPALKTWHKGELAVQSLMNLPQRVSLAAVVDALPEQHRIFHSSKLFFLPVTTLDHEGRPWASVLTSSTGLPGFIKSPTESELLISAHVWDGDPILRNLGSWKHFGEGEVLLSAVGLETSTRRRNKFAGSVVKADLHERDLSLGVHVNQALGLCPKYINVRELSPYLEGVAQVVHQEWAMKEGSRLPPAVVDFIHSSDTAYLASHFQPAPEEASVTPAHVGTNHRGGRSGFVRVRPTDGRTLVLPNYAGNRLMNSLGNIYVTPRAGLVFPAFANGSILYVTGDAKSVFGEEAHQLMPGAKSLTLIRVTGYSLVERALPFREMTPSERSPYCPPVLYLAEETPPNNSFDDIFISLIRVRVHNASLVTLTFHASQPVFADIKPSGNVVLDLSDFIRIRSHELMDWIEDGRKNDDCVRTWTVSIPPTKNDPNVFSITIRNVPGGLVTPVLYRIAHQAAKGSNEDVEVSSLNIRARLGGIGGELPVPEAIAACDGGRKLLWIAGGIGITPFLGLTRYVAHLVRQTYGLWDITFVISTREPDVIVTLISDALDELRDVPTPQDLQLTVHLYSPIPFKLSNSIAHVLPPFVKLHIYQGRIGEDGANVFEAVGAPLCDPYICGPLPFVTNSMDLLAKAGVPPESVKRERFTY